MKNQNVQMFWIFKITARCETCFTAPKFTFPLCTGNSIYLNMLYDNIIKQKQKYNKAPNVY